MAQHALFLLDIAYNTLLTNAESHITVHELLRYARPRRDGRAVIFEGIMIGTKAYFREWLAFRGMTQSAAAARMAQVLNKGASETNLSRVIAGNLKRGWDNRHLAAFAHVVNAEPIDILRKPGDNVVTAFSIDRHLLRDVVIRVETEHQETPHHMPPKKKAELVLALCDVLGNRRRKDPEAHLAPQDVEDAGVILSRTPT